MKLNETDQNLLNLLRSDGRMSTAELARTLGRSRTTIQSRIESLQKQGVIDGFTVRLGGAYAKSLVQALIMITVPPRASAKVEGALRKFNAVEKLYSVSGTFDMIAHVFAPDIAAMDFLIDEIGALDGVERTVSSIILSTRIAR